MTRKSLKLKIRAALFYLFCCVSQTGCLATLVHDSASSSLCEVENDNGWSMRGGSGRKVDDVVYSFHVRDSVGWKRSAPLDGVGVDDVHWISMDVGTGASVGGVGIALHGIPIIYDPKEAELEVDGKMIKSLPKIWKVGRDEGPILVSMPTDLNTTENKHSPDFIIAFPIKIKLSPKTEYIFRPGTILLDGVRYPLPVYKSCYRPSSWRWYPIN